MAVQQLEVARQAEDDERDRGDERPRVARGHGVERVGDDRGAGDGREQLVDERERVALEHRAAGRALGADEHELGPPLAEREEEREECRADEEPGRDLHVHGDRARGCPDHEEPRDHEHVDEDDVLEPERVRRLQRDEGEEARDRERAEDADDRERGEPERDGEDTAARGRSSPRAIGRRRLTGCCRSASMSRRSLTR